MIRTERINIIASKYAPNPLEVSYWIDLTADSAGGTIKTYNGTEWKIISAKGSGGSTGGSDESEHVQEIIKTVGLSYNSNTDTITLPSLSSNEYFKGSSLVNAVVAGDAAIKIEFDTVNNSITSVSTNLLTEINKVDGKISSLTTQVSGLNTTVGTLQSDVTTAKSDIAQTKTDLQVVSGKVDQLVDGGESAAAVSVRLNDFIATKGQAEGLATLNEAGKIPESQLPSYVDDVVEAANQVALPTTGESGKIYVTTDTNLTYRWSGTGYVEISPSIALGETASTAYAGDKGKTVTDALAAHKADTSNPHDVNKTQVGLSNVDNTSDANKPVSTAQATAIADAKSAGTTAQTSIANHIADKVNPHSVNKEQVGLGNVDNTSDLSKPVSTATQSAINTKATEITESVNTLLSGKVSGTGITSIQVVESLPGTPVDTVLYIVASEGGVLG